MFAVFFDLNNGKASRACSFLGKFDCKLLLCFWKVVHEYFSVPGRFCYLCSDELACRSHAETGALACPELVAGPAEVFVAVVALHFLSVPVFRNNCGRTVGTCFGVLLLPVDAHPAADLFPLSFGVACNKGDFTEIPFFAADISILVQVGTPEFVLLLDIDLILNRVSDSASREIVIAVHVGNSLVTGDFINFFDVDIQSLGLSQFSKSLTDNIALLYFE